MASNPSKTNKYDICIVVPCYNEEECISTFYETATKEIANGKESSNKEINIESDEKHNEKSTKNPNIHPYFLFVNDGSADNSLQEMQKLAKEHSNVGYTSLSRNFGKESAIYAGLETAYNKINTKYYALMDVDLQDPPALLPQMYNILENGETADPEAQDGKIDDYKAISRVGTRRCTRKGEPAMRSWFARRFYGLMNRSSQVELVDGARDFQLMKPKYVKAILDCKEYNRFFKGLSQWVGFKTHWLEFENIERTQGESSWSFWSLFKYSLEGIIGFTTWPLKFISVMGLILSFIAVIALIFVLVRAAVAGDPVAGWPSLACIILLGSGLMLTSMGILGLYFEKMYTEIKKRPIYLVDEE